MKATKKDKEYFKKLGRIIEKENNKRMRELGKLSAEEKINLIFGKRKPEQKNRLPEPSA